VNRIDLWIQVQFSVLLGSKFMFLLRACGAQPKLLSCFNVQFFHLIPWVCGFWFQSKIQQTRAEIAQKRVVLLAGIRAGLFSLTIAAARETVSTFNWGHNSAFEVG
jgi:hypothetical protein